MRKIQFVALLSSMAMAASADTLEKEYQTHLQGLAHSLYGQASEIKLVAAEGKENTYIGTATIHGLALHDVVVVKDKTLVGATITRKIGEVGDLATKNTKTKQPENPLVAIYQITKAEQEKDKSASKEVLQQRVAEQVEHFKIDPERDFSSDKVKAYTDLVTAEMESNGADAGKAVEVTSNILTEIINRSSYGDGRSSRSRSNNNDLAMTSVITGTRGTLTVTDKGVTSLYSLEGVHNGSLKCESDATYTKHNCAVAMERVHAGEFSATKVDGNISYKRGEGMDVSFNSMLDLSGFALDDLRVVGHRQTLEGVNLRGSLAGEKLSLSINTPEMMLRERRSLVEIGTIDINLTADGEAGHGALNIDFGGLRTPYLLVDPSTFGLKVAGLDTETTTVTANTQLGEMSGVTMYLGGPIGDLSSLKTELVSKLPTAFVMQQAGMAFAGAGPDFEAPEWLQNIHYKLHVKDMMHHAMNVGELNLDAHLQLSDDAKQTSDVNAKLDFSNLRLGERREHYLAKSGLIELQFDAHEGDLLTAIASGDMAQISKLLKRSRMQAKMESVFIGQRREWYSIEHVSLDSDGDPAGFGHSNISVKGLTVMDKNQVGLSLDGADFTYKAVETPTDEMNITLGLSSEGLQFDDPDQTNHVFSDTVIKLNLNDIVASAWRDLVALQMSETAHREPEKMFAQMAKVVAKSPKLNGHATATNAEGIVKYKLESSFNGTNMPTEMQGFGTEKWGKRVNALITQKANASAFIRLMKDAAVMGEGPESQYDQYDDHISRQIEFMTKQGIVVQEGDELNSTLEVKDGAVTLNGKLIDQL